ncbi:MAG: TRL domain-containing protein [Chloroherpetonaceae bacterium]|nr:TRL-like family protein [Chloroherpetonaceae bacterium]MDW8019485.1 TRL domain-containing protein [Chloroherpetonaceae bacterium]MDW8465883.1 TRL domain-containing protein [Chloroherpetonaceae bacterium]
MKKVTAFLSALLLAFSLNACTVTFPVAVSGNQIGQKVGKASSSIILGLFAFGDSSIQAAAKNGGITKISTVDVQFTSILLGSIRALRSS